MSTLYRARVVRMDAEGVFVEIPELGEGNEWGPLEMAPVPLAAGDGVIVGSINDILEDLALVAKLVTVAVATNNIQAYYFENEAARTAAGLSPTSGTLTWLDDEQRLDIYTDEGTPGWVQYYGFRNNQLILPDTHKFGLGNGFPSARIDVTSALNWYPILGSNVAADSQKRWSVDADGNTQWGPGSAALDAFIKRTGVGHLQIGNQIGVGGTVSSTASVTARQATNRVGFFSNNTETSVTHTQPHFHAIEAGTASSRLLESWMSGETIARYRIYMDGEMQWGNGTTMDCYLWRDAVGVMGLEADLDIVGDLDAEDVQVASKSLPRGIVTYQENTASVTGITTTFGNVMALPSFTYKANRIYKITMSVGVFGNTANAYADMRVYRTTTSTQFSEFFRVPMPVTSQSYAAHGTRVFRTGGSDVTAVLGLMAAASAGTVGVFGSAGSPGQFYIEDMGAAGATAVNQSLVLS